MNVREILENMVLENQEVVGNDFPGIELVDEYRNIEKPEFDWNPKDNLIAASNFHLVCLFQKGCFKNLL